MNAVETGFRNALGLFPTGVAIVTTEMPNGDRIGTTVSSFNSVSLSPPLVLFSIARSSYAFQAWAEAERYAVNVLAEDQDDISTRFARAREEKWMGLRSKPGVTAPVLLHDALAWFECESYSRYDGGDHLILVGHVVSFAVSPDALRRPLVFYRGRYRRLDQSDQLETPAGVGQLVHGW